MIPADEHFDKDFEVHFKALGTCWVIYGIIRLITAVWLISFSNKATVMFGALLGRVPDPFTLMNVFHFIYDVMVFLSLVCGALGLVAGMALIGGHKFGRQLALVAGFLSLSGIPVGLTLGIYTLIILLPLHEVHTSRVGAHGRIPELRGHPSAL